MVKTFTLKKLFEPDEFSDLVRNFGLKRQPEAELERNLQGAFMDYVLSALSELGDTAQDNRKLYEEAMFHLERAGKLLEGMPHPAGKMSYRLDKMCETLNKVIRGQADFSADRAHRFMEKNLVRRLRDIWLANTSTPFHVGGDRSGKNPRDFILACFAAAGEQYPQITWFHEVDLGVADMLIKNIKRH